MKPSRRALLQFSILSILVLTTRQAKGNNPAYQHFECRPLTSAVRLDQNRELETYYPSSYFEKLDDKKFAGKGSNGVVFTGNYNGMQLAVKIVPNDEVMLPEIIALQRFKNIDGIVKFEGCEIGDKYIFIYQQKLETNLEDINLLEAIRKLKFDKKLQLYADLSNTVAAIHTEEFLNRDIKPENMMVAKGSINRIYIIDLGSASHKNEKVRIGSPWFWSPELWMNDEHFQNKKDDVWALALSIGEIEFDRDSFYPVDYESCIKEFSDKCQKDLIKSLRKVHLKRKQDYVNVCGEDSASLFLKTLEKGLAFYADKRASSYEMALDFQRAASLCTRFQLNQIGSKNLGSSFIRNSNNESNTFEAASWYDKQKPLISLYNKESASTNTNESDPHMPSYNKKLFHYSNNRPSSNLSNLMMAKFNKVLIESPSSNDLTESNQRLGSNYWVSSQLPKQNEARWEFHDSYATEHRFDSQSKGIADDQKLSTRINEENEHDPFHYLNEIEQSLYKKKALMRRYDEINRVNASLDKQIEELLLERKAQNEKIESLLRKNIRRNEQNKLEIENNNSLNSGQNPFAKKNMISGAERLKAETAGNYSKNVQGRLFLI